MESSSHMAKPIYSLNDLQSSMQLMNQHNSLILNPKPENLLGSSIYNISNDSNDKVKKPLSTDIKYPMRYYKDSTKLAITAYLGSGKKNFRPSDIFSKFSSDSKANPIQQEDFSRKMPINLNLTELKILLEAKQKEIDDLKKENHNIALQLEQLQHEKEAFEFSDEFIYKTAQKEKNSCNHVAKILEGSFVKGSYSQFSTRGSAFSSDMSSPKRLNFSLKKTQKKNKSPLASISSITSLTQIQKIGSSSPIKYNESMLQYGKRPLTKVISPVGSIITREVEKPNIPREVGSIGIWMIDSQKSISKNSSTLKIVSTSKSLSPERTKSLPRGDKKIQPKLIRDEPYGKFVI